MRVLMPTSLEEACALRADHPDAVPIAGGTDVMVHWPQNLSAHDRTYLDLSGLEDTLRHHELSANTLTLGALTTYWDVVRDPAIALAFPLLISAARQVGAVQIQTRGTWAGNIVNASPAADGVPVLMAYDAELELVSRPRPGATELETERIPLARFYRGYKDLQLRPDQLIRAIHMPRRVHDVEIFEKVGPRRAQAITKVGVAVTHSDAGWRVVANSMAPAVCRCPELEKRLAQQGVDPITSPDDLLPAIRTDVAPIDDIRSTARYRERVLARVLCAAIT